MRVLHFVEALKGGPATYLQTLLPFQAATYEAVTVLCPQSQAHLLECPGTEIVSYPDTGRHAWGVAALARHFKGQLELARYDIAHLHSTFAGVAGRLGWSRQASGPRLIYCPHGWSFAMDTGIARKGAYAVAEWLLARRADAIINVSANENALAARAGIAPVKSALVPGGIPDRA